MGHMDFVGGRGGCYMYLGSTVGLLYSESICTHGFGGEHFIGNPKVGD